MAVLPTLLTPPSPSLPCLLLAHQATLATADALLLFSRSNSEGSPAAAACADPTDEAVAALWEACEVILRREVEVGWGWGAVGRRGVGLLACGLVVSMPALAHPHHNHTSPPPPSRQLDDDADAAAITAAMAPARRAATSAAQLAVFQTVPQHAWLAAQLVSQWVGPEAAVTHEAVARWAPVADVVKDACRWGGAACNGGVIELKSSSALIAHAPIPLPPQPLPRPTTPRRLLRKTAPEALPGIYLQALQAAHSRIQPGAGASCLRRLPACLCWVGGRAGSVVLR